MSDYDNNVIDDYSNNIIDVEDAVVDCSYADILAAVKASKARSAKKTSSAPNGSYISIPKSDMYQVLGVADLVLDSKLMSGNGKLNFIEFHVADDTVCVKFRNTQNYITIRLQATVHDMPPVCLAFFKDDLKSYVRSCYEEEFIIKKDDDADKYKVNLFGNYCYVKVGIGWSANPNYQRMLVDTHDYEESCTVHAIIMRTLVQPLARIAEKRPKNEGATEMSRVHFCDRKAIITCADKSFYTQSYPANMTFPDCTIGASFINILSMLLTEDCRGSVRIGLSQTQRIKVTTDEFELSGCLYKTFSSEARQACDIADTFGVEFTRIDQDLLRRIAGYACYMRLCTKTIGFNYSSDESVKCYVLHNDEGKSYQYPLPLNLENCSTGQPLKEPVIVSAQTLRWLLKAFEGNNDNLELCVQNGRVILRKGDSYIVLCEEG